MHIAALDTLRLRRSGRRPGSNSIVYNIKRREGTMYEAEAVDSRKARCHKQRHFRTKSCATAVTARLLPARTKYRRTRLFATSPIPTSDFLPSSVILLVPADLNMRDILSKPSHRISHHGGNHLLMFTGLQRLAFYKSVTSMPILHPFVLLAFHHVPNGCLMQAPVVFTST